MSERPSPEYPIRSAEEIREATLADGGGIPFDVVRKLLGQDDPTALYDLAPADHVKEYKQHARKRHNAVRDFESDRDHDEFAQVDLTPFTPEELLVRDEGLAHVQSDAVDDINYKAALKRANGNEKLAQIFYRAAQDRRARDRGDERPEAS